jgi:hypothetical protein
MCDWVLIFYFLEPKKDANICMYVCMYVYSIWIGPN